MSPALVLVAGVLVALGGACSTSGRNVDSSATASTSEAGGAVEAAATASTTTTTEAPRGPLGSGQPVTIAFAGDASFENLSGSVVSNTNGLLSAIAPVLSAADVAMVNVETAVGSGGSPVAKTFTFQTPQAALDSLAVAGVDVVTLANNHGMDYGLDGLTDTLRIKAEGSMPMVGIGADEAEAYAPFITEVKGQRIGVIAANDVFDSNLVTSWTAGPGKPGIASAEEAHQERLAAEVRAPREQVDTLAVYRRSRINI